MRPAHYSKLSPKGRRAVREAYVQAQKGLCYHCGAKLSGEPDKDIMGYAVDWGLFPTGFLNFPVHLHHDHNTDLTIGAVHARCNAVLWQFFGE